MDNQLTILKRDALGRVRSTAEARAEAVAEYRRSGLSASAFARMAGISKNTFWNWLQSHGLTQKRDCSPSKSNGHPPVRFVEVAAQTAPASAFGERGQVNHIAKFQKFSSRAECLAKSAFNSPVLCITSWRAEIGAKRSSTMMKIGGCF